MANDIDPFGRKVRLGRLGDEETTRRMLEVGVSRVTREGIRYSFDRLNFETLITDAQVSRSAVYRKWPTRNHFYADLLRELSREEHTSTATFENSAHSHVVEAFVAYGSELATPTGRRWLLIELGRLGSQREFELNQQSKNITVFEVLGATLQGLPEETQLRDDLTAQLSLIESRFVERMGTFYSALLFAAGWRIKASLPNFKIHHLVDLGVAAVGGIGMRDGVSSPSRETVFVGDPFTTGRDAEWTHASLRYMGAVLNVIEPEPSLDHEWSAEFVGAHLAKFAAFVERSATANVIVCEEGLPDGA